MPQIINENQNFGSLLGTGLASGLNVLAQNKLNQFAGRQQRNMTAQGLASLGIPEQNAMQIAGLPEKLQELVVKNYLAAAESQGLNEALAALSGEPQQQQLPGAQNFYQQAAPQQNPQLSALQNLISSGQGVTPEAFGQQLSQGASQAPQAQAPKGGVIPTYNDPQQRAERQKSFADILKTARISPEHKLKLAAMQQSQKLEKEKLSAKEQQIVNQETKPLYDEITKGARAAQNNNKRLDRMEELAKRGNLTYPLFASALETLSNGIFGFGIDLTALLHQDSQEFRKLSNDFLKDAKDTFGSRLTNYDVKTFLSTVPTLSQSHLGKLRVINNLRSFNEAALLRKKAMDKIIQDNGGRRPANLDVLVEERISPQLDVLAEKFKSGEKI